MDDHTIPCNALIKVEADVEHIKERLDDMKSVGENLSRLTTLMELQQESNNTQNTLMQQQSDQLILLSNTVEKLNDKIDRTDKKVEDLDTTLNAQLKKDTISIADIRNKVLKVIGGLVASALAIGIIKMIIDNIKL